jgi:hypothetical protein
MRRALWSALLLTVLSGCGSQPVVQQCAPMQPFPAELEAEPQNLNLLLDRIISICGEGTTSNTDCSSSAGRN